MRPFASLLIVAAVAATLQPSYAQGPAARPLARSAQPAAAAASANAAAGLCQCLYPASLPDNAFGKTHLVVSCLGSVDQCKSRCNTTVLYSFVPTPHSCTAPPAEPSSPVASNRR